METPKLTLGFVGDAEVHRNNSLALLKDLVGAFLKQHRKADVEILLPEWDNPTDTMNDIDDWASTSGYDVAHVSAGDIVTELLKEEDARLILVGDPNEDDVVYAVAEEAAKYKIQIRSLINGLEKVVFDEDDFDDDDIVAGDGFHEVDLDDEDEDDIADDIELDLDVLAALADDGEVGAQEEIKTVANSLNIDTTPFETWADAVSAIRGEVKFDKIEAAETIQELFDAGETEVTAPPEPDEDTIMPVAAPTRERLEALTFDQIKAVALDYGIPSGRGMKHAVFVNKILQAAGVETEAPKTKGKKKPAPKLEAVPGVAAIAKEEDNVHPIRPEHPAEQTIAQMIAGALRAVAEQLDPMV